MEYRDCDEIHGVGRDADEKEIKHAYRQPTLNDHAHKYPGYRPLEERFEAIKAAHEVRGDEATRCKNAPLAECYRSRGHMQCRQAGLDRSQRTRGSGAARIEARDLGALFGEGFSDFFNAIFCSLAGQGFRFSQARAHGHDLEQPVAIGFLGTYRGTIRTFLWNGPRLEVKILAGAKAVTSVRSIGKDQPGKHGLSDLYRNKGATRWENEWGGARALPSPRLHAIC